MITIKESLRNSWKFFWRGGLGLSGIMAALAVVLLLWITTGAILSTRQLLFLFCTSLLLSAFLSLVPPLFAFSASMLNKRRPR